MSEILTVEVHRQEGPGAKAFRERFLLPFQPGWTVKRYLLEIQRRPTTDAGQVTTPPLLDGPCGPSGHCGVCTVNINRQPAPACSVVVPGPSEPLVVEPLLSFPVIRDLVVDRRAMERGLAAARLWTELDDGEPPAPEARSQDEIQAAQTAAACTFCGACQEACPMVNPRSPYAGPAIMQQAYAYLAAAPSTQLSSRLALLAQDTGAGGCGSARNCSQICPQGLPVASSVASIQSQLTAWAWHAWRTR